MGATKDLYRRAAAAAPELGLTELVVEDHRRSALMREARAVTLPPSLSSIVRDAVASPLPPKSPYPNLRRRYQTDRFGYMVVAARAEKARCGPSATPSKSGAEFESIEAFENMPQTWWRS